MTWKHSPTIRRMDYVVKGTDNMQSGFLYAQFRHLSFLSIYNNPNLTDDRKAADFAAYKSVIIGKLIWVNDWMAANGRDPIFTDVNDWRAIGADYDYFWELRTEEQFAQEEADARAGLSGRKPVFRE